MALKVRMTNMYLSWRRKGKEHDIALKHTISWVKGVRHFAELYDDSEIERVAKELDEEWKNKEV